MKKRLISIVCLILFVSLFIFPPLQAQEKAKEESLKGYSEFINELIKEWKIPGLAISIVKDGKVIFSEGFGFRDIKKGLKVTPRTLFAIGSCSKAFTATTVGLLVDEDKVDWDKPVREYLPSFKLEDSFASERMTPRDLVCHRSGLPRHDLMWYNSSASRKELFDRLRYLEPSRDFRTTYQYQNLKFLTAGYLVGQVAKTSWEEFVQERIFDPLGMNDSNFSVEDSKKAPDFALPYAERKEKIVEIPFRNIDTIGPAGSINSNVTDMAKWVLLNLNKGKVGEKQIISEASLKQIHSPQMLSSQSIRYDELFYSSYGMGWGITAYRGHLMVSHGGGIDGFSALVSLMPRDNMGIVILTNKGNPITSIVAYNAYDRLLGLDQVDWNKRTRERMDEAEKEAEKAKEKKDKDRKLNTKPSHPFEDYTGDFEHPGYGVVSITKEGNQLKGVYNSIEFAMKHYHYDVFEFLNELMNTSMKVSYSTDVKGNIHSLAIKLERAVKEIVFTRMPPKKMKEKSFLEKFAGEYELEGTTVKIHLKGKDTLFLSVPGQPEYELIPYRGTEFYLKNLDGFSIEFILDESGAVTEAKVVQPNGTLTAKKKK
ncbi:MAG: serine hydrolase [Candidatus Aminicenantes bacterium]|nr:MAG: serine hydrolase [Candidatus Aminicenantes bacterium]